MSFIKGIDVASYQPGTFSTAGLSFVFVKATEGVGYVNPDYHEQVDTSRKGKCVTGHYHFLNLSSIEGQVNHFKNHAAVKPGDLIAVDWESDNGVWPSNTAKDKMIKLLKAKYPQNRVGLYTNRDGWINRDHTSYCGDFLWIADPGTAGKPRIQHAWTFHQYAVTGGFDRNVGNFQTIDALRKWAGGLIPVKEVSPVPVTPEYRAVMLNDVYPRPSVLPEDGHGKFLTIQDLLSYMFSLVHENNAMLSRIIEEIESNKAVSEAEQS